MPTYDYVCGACGHEFEEFQSITHKPLRKCPACGKLKLKRLIGTGAGVIFKGSGFYETDYRSEGYKKAAKAEADSSSGKTPDAKSKKEDTSHAKPQAPSDKSSSQPTGTPKPDTKKKNKE